MRYLVVLVLLFALPAFAQHPTPSLTGLKTALENEKVKMGQATRFDAVGLPSMHGLDCALVVEKCNPNITSNDKNLVVFINVSH